MLLSRDSRERPKLQKAYTTTTRVPLSSTPSKLSTRPSLSRPPLTKSKTSVQEEDDNYMNSIIAGTLPFLRRIVDEWDASSNQVDVVRIYLKVTIKALEQCQSMLL